MYILAFDTCFDAVSVAVAHGPAGSARVLVAAAERRRSGHACERRQSTAPRTSAAACPGGVAAPCC